LATDCKHDNKRHYLPNGVCDSNFPESDTAAIQAKLDEIIRATEGHPALVGIEEHTQDEIAQIKEERSQT
jgi:low affinity Fe/Cu permease